MGFVGLPDFFVQGNYDQSFTGYTFLIFQTVFCATAATIVSGAMAERTKFSAYLLYSVVISAVIYPISGHWIWGGGWLSQLGFHDFAGSTAVHMVGGVAALVGAKILGPRIGKYDEGNNSKAIPGQSLPLAALGVLIFHGTDFCQYQYGGGSGGNHDNVCDLEDLWKARRFYDLKWNFGRFGGNHCGLRYGIACGRFSHRSGQRFAGGSSGGSRGQGIAH